MAGWLASMAAAADSLLYPRLCLGCEQNLDTQDGAYTCAACSIQLPFTQQHELPENELTDRLAGRVKLVFGAALFYYQPNSAVQRMVHALKYYQRPDIAYSLGELYGQRLKKVNRLSDLAGIIPVPLHPRREQERGYNQAERLGAGLAKSLGIPQWPRMLNRHSFVESQTRKDSQERVENVTNSFVAASSKRLDGLHILLVDDVMTTGATLDFCAEALSQVYPEIRISIATIGMAL